MPLNESSLNVRFTPNSFFLLFRFVLFCFSVGTSMSHSFNKLQLSEPVLLAPGIRCASETPLALLVSVPFLQLRPVSLAPRGCRQHTPLQGDNCLLPKHLQTRPLHQRWFYSPSNLHTDFHGGFEELLLCYGLAGLRGTVPVSLQSWVFESPLFG